jgi:hypothetical protein
MNTRKTQILKSVKLPFLFLIAAFIYQTAFSQDYTGSKVFVDPSNKTNISGNIGIAFAWGERLSSPRQYARGLINLKEAMTKYTKIQATIEPSVRLSTDKIFSLPFLYISSDKSFDLTDNEKENMKKYFQAGGFVVAENSQPKGEASAGGSALKQMLRDTVPNAKFMPIQNSHILYHCFFDFDVPPQGAEVGTYGNYGNVTRKTADGEIDQAKQDRMQNISPQVLTLEGVWSGDRLVAIYSDKGYLVKWTEGSNNEPQLKMGINMIVFALTQAGGMAAPK